jgi:hypothetical protein
MGSLEVLFVSSLLSTVFYIKTTIGALVISHVVSGKF